MNEKRMVQRIKWNAYLLYLKEWSDNHKNLEFFGMSPVCFDEWEDNEAEMNKEE